uniref:Glycosyl transferase family 11 n=1 Tax=Chlorobium phaeobacteroides (strain BS1) TaxID=331678 RepID=B3ELZ7_CHLPB
MDKVVVHLTGGLGNQMFQYALGRSISINRNCPLLLNTSFYDTYDKFSCGLSRYNVKAEFIKKNSYYNNKYYRYVIRLLSRYGVACYFGSYYEKKIFSYDEKVYKRSCVSYYGTWQSYGYFDSIRDILLRDYEMVGCLEEEVEKYVSDIKRVDSVSLHIRRGDYFDNKRLQSIHGILTMEYYYKAMSLFPDSSVFYVFSDDIEWVRENLITNTNIVYVVLESDNPENEIYLMSLCKNNIISNSTFSWWGAWLNKNKYKKVIAPRMWYKDNQSSSDLMPSDWCLI